MRVAITGASGRIGRALVLRATGWEPIPLLRSGSSSPLNTVVPSRLVDFDDPHHLRMVLRELRPDVVLHLAGMTSGTPEGMRSVNVDLTQNMIEAAAAANAAKFVLASSAAVYGTTRQRPLREGDELLPETAYGRSKVEAEAALADAVRRGDLASGTALRIFNVYGPDFDGSLVNRLIASTRDHPVSLQGVDEFVRDYLHVECVARGLFLAVRDQSFGSRTYNIGSGVGVSNRQLVERLRERRPVFTENQGERQSFSVADIALARTELGFQPRPVAL